VIVEERIYTLKPDCIDLFLELYEKEGMPIQLRHLPRMLGFFVSEIGVLNQVTHMWGYADFEERTRCRAAMRADPEWAAYVGKSRAFFERQENRILVPTRWSPIR
jgi:hypothetical protein